MKILLIGSRESSFVYNLALELSKKQLSVHIFDPDTLNLYDVASHKKKTFCRIPKKVERNRLLSYIFKSAKVLRFLKENRGEYDVCHIHYILSKFLFMTHGFKGFAGRFVVTVFGSDFYRRNRIFRRWQKKLLQSADAITVLHEGMKNELVAFYGPSIMEKIQILRFGLRPLDYIDNISDESIESSKTTLEIPEDSIIVACGYASFSEQHQTKVVDILEKIINDVPQNVFFLFPLTYGESSFREIIKERLKNSTIPYRIFEEKMSDIDVARLRRVSDILINVQDTDQLSGSMLEHMYAGSIVISGSWLPYDILLKKGVFFLSVDSIEDLTQGIKDGIRSLERYKKQALINREIISRMSRWENNISQWIEFYKDLLAA